MHVDTMQKSFSSVYSDPCHFLICVSTLRCRGVYFRLSEGREARVTCTFTYYVAEVVNLIRLDFIIV